MGLHFGLICGTSTACACGDTCVLTDEDQLQSTTNTAASTRTADVMVSQLEARIASGELADGSFLPAERELMAQYAISRTAVREAIARLASRGMLDARPRFRPIVRRPSVDAAISAANGIVTLLLDNRGGVKNLYDTRVFLEAALARNAAMHARKDDIVALRSALAANEEAIPDSGKFYATDTAFHAVLYDVPRNPVFPALHRAFTTWLSTHWERMLRSPERNRVNYLSHREIYLAIADRDPDNAELALRNHLSAAWEYVRGTFDTE
jgi:DNA-binding FadR family transcriptional regulator